MNSYRTHQVTHKDSPICCGKKMVIENEHYNGSAAVLAFRHFLCLECKKKECQLVNEPMV